MPLHAGHWWVGWLWALCIAGAAGALGAVIGFSFAQRMSMRRRYDLRPCDYEMAGVTATVVVPIRADGTGEILVSQAGTRRCSAARSAGRGSIEKGTSAIVLWYEEGIAYVQPCAMLGLEDPAPPRDGGLFSPGFTDDTQRKD